MNYQEMYQQKLVTAEEAVKVVKSGDWVDYTWCTNHPIELDKALAARKDELYDVKIRGGVTMWMPEIAKAEDAGDHFTWHSWHCSGIDRKIITCEEHSVIGGLGEAVCSVLSEKCPTPVRRIGVNDEFGHSGPAGALLKQFGLCADHIVEVAKEFLNA